MGTAWGAIPVSVSGGWGRVRSELGSGGVTGASDARAGGVTGEGVTVSGEAGIVVVGCWVPEPVDGDGTACCG